MHALRIETVCTKWHTKSEPGFDPWFTRSCAPPTPCLVMVEWASLAATRHRVNTSAPRSPAWPRKAFVCVRCRRVPRATVSLPCHARLALFLQCSDLQGACGLWSVGVVLWRPVNRVEAHPQPSLSSRPTPHDTQPFVLRPTCAHRTRHSAGGPGARR